MIFLTVSGNIVDYGAVRPYDPVQTMAVSSLLTVTSILCLVLSFVEALHVENTVFLDSDTFDKVLRAWNKPVLIKETTSHHLNISIGLLNVRKTLF